MTEHDALSEHYAVICIAGILREHTMSQLRGVNSNQFPLENYFTQARHIASSVFSACQDHYERVADKAMTSEERVFALMKSDVFIKLIRDITKENNT